MSNHKLRVFSVVLLSLIVILAGCGRPKSTPPDTYYDTVTLDRAQELAEDFVRDSPTFTYDGIAESLEPVSRCPKCSLIILEFDSAHAGYGDRTGQVLPEQITHHQVQIYFYTSFANGSDSEIEIVDAVMDLKWDMIKQEPIN